MRIKPRFLIGAGLIIAAIIYLIVLGIRSTSEYYLTVDEAVARQTGLMGQAVRVAGRVKAGSIRWDPAALALSFAIAPLPPQDGAKIEPISVHPPQEIQVVCKGQPKPDMFAAGRDVIVEGHLTAHNFVTADQVMTSCPSKYRAKKTG
ncbi:MAG TPA: cytochrome c maturation protein CcmE [Candidatus Binataceae bacterium]|nr:cytochrome c maturation protein CcmE [Candidatus Binataceae bacterium]